MDAAILVSIAIRAIAVVRSLFLWKRLGDWRLSVLSTMLFLMFLRQFLTLIEHARSAAEAAEPWSLVEFGHATELPGLAVSVLALFGLVQLERWLTGLSHAEKALRVSERSLAEAQRIAHLGNWEWDLRADAQQLSDEIYRIFGVDRQEFEATFTSFLAAVHPDDRARVQHTLQRTLEDGDPYDIEFRVIRPDGGERILHARAEVTYNADGKPASLFGTGQDITARKRAEAALRESEEKYRTLFEHSPAGIGVTDEEGNILAFNDAMLEAGGYSRKDVARVASVADLYYDPVDRKEIRDLIMAGSLVRHREVRMKAKNGSPYYVSLSVVPVTMNQRPCLLAIAEDITDRKEVEDAYRASNELRRLVLSHIDEIVYSIRFNRDDLFRAEVDFVSEKARSIVGYEPDDFIHDPELWFRSVHPDDVPQIQGDTQEILRSGKPSTREYRLRHKETGAYRWMEDLVVPRFDEHDRVVGLFGVARDVTHRKQAEDELRRSREALRRLAIREQAVREEERTSIAREIHDQLGQAMTALRIELSWLHQKLADSPDAAPERTQSMLSMIDQTADAVRNLSSRLRPAALDDLGLPAAIEWEVREFSRRTDVQCAVEVPSKGLDVDPDRATGLFRILQESLTNVARHAKASQVNVQLHADGEDLVLRVHDNGKGISKGDVASSESFGLLGMRERATALRGSVTIEPSSAGGTTVTAKVPK
ncbi:MAG: PAS domain S-box protein [Gemmatimonadales bacterium]|nr:PAS domain S-box protein [Gemmatimonadales bacterium]